MWTVLTLACVLFAALHSQKVAAQTCQNFRTYTEEFYPKCEAQDVYILWPYYENPSYYYRCNGIGNPVLTSCPISQYFTYVYQMCTPCDQYIAPVKCDQLKTQSTPNCQPIGSVTPSPGTPTDGPGPSPNSPGLPTPQYPNGTSVATTTSKTTTTKDATTKTTTTKTTTTKTTKTPGVPTPPSEGGGSTIIPNPPSPVTNNPDIPMPSTPIPTPPSVSNEPPSVPEPPVGPVT